MLAAQCKPLLRLTSSPVISKIDNILVWQSPQGQQTRTHAHLGQLQSYGNLIKKGTYICFCPACSSIKAEQQGRAYSQEVGMQLSSAAQQPW